MATPILSSPKTLFISLDLDIDSNTLTFNLFLCVFSQSEYDDARAAWQREKQTLQQLLQESEHEVHRLRQESVDRMRRDSDGGTSTDREKVRGRRSVMIRDILCLYPLEPSHTVQDAATE